MKRRRWALLSVAALMALVAVALSAQTTDLQVTKSGTNVILSFSNTATPWRVVRSDAPQFNYANVLLDPANVTGTFTDTQAALLPQLQFFDVSSTGAGETPADEGQPTEEPIILTSLNLNYGWENETITINGSGFGDMPTDNFVYFGSSLATITGGTATTLTVTVPVGVSNCVVIVQRGSLSSNTLPFTAVLAGKVGVTPFQDISSIVVNDRTGDATSRKHLFIADMGTNGVTSDNLWEVMDDYSLTSRTWWNDMKGLPMDAAGNLYLANTLLASNAGQIKKYDAVTHVLTTYTTGKQSGETNSVSIVGMTVRNDGIVHLANRFNNTLRRRDPAGTGATIFASGYPLDLYMGMAMDSAQTIYFTSGGTLYKTPSGFTASVTTVATGFTNASGIAIDETTGNTLILLADRGAGKVYLLNAQTGFKEEVGSGLNSPRAVAFGEDKVTGALYYYVAEPDRVLRLPDPKIKLDSRISGGSIKVLISKKGTNDGYPCSLQTQEAKIKIPFEAKGIETPTTVYAKLYDPKDPSPYVTGAVNDNLDPNKNGGAGAGSFQACLSATAFPVDASNRKGEVTLTITNRYAGDNYQVGFSFNPTFLTDPAIEPIAITGTLTAWKRVYIEKDKMFKRGGLLFSDFNKDTCAPNCNKVLLYDWTTVTDGDTIVIFDESTTVEAGGEVRTVAGAPVPGPPSSGYVTVTLNASLTKNYYMSSQDASAPPKPIFDNGHSGGVGVPSAGYYEADTRKILAPFNDGYVDISVKTGGAVPYLPPTMFSGFELASGGSCGNLLTQQIAGYSFAPLFKFGWIWFSARGTPNHIWLGGAGGTAPLDGCTIGCAGEYPMPQYLGLSAANSQLSFVMAGHHQLYCDFTQNGIQENSNHEIGHDFFLNPGSSLGHDNRCQWAVDGALPCSTAPATCAASADPNGCVMNPSRELWTNKHRFDRYDLLCGDSACPNSTPGCCIQGSPGCTVPGNGSIRQLSDLVQGVSP